MMTSDLPANVRPVTDRHGKVRYRFRRAGWKGGYLPGEPGTAEFHRAYADLLAKGPEDVTPTSPRKVNPRTLDDLCNRLRKSPRWRRMSPRSQVVQGQVLDRFCARVDSRGRRYGDRPVANITVAWLDNVLGGMWETPGAANDLRKKLTKAMDYAQKLEWITSNPVRLTEQYQAGEGFHDWTDAEIDQYRGTHPLGTMARFVLELALNTAARRCNVATLTRDNLRDGRIHVAHAKDNNEASVPLLPSTLAALDALPAAPIRHLVTTVHGKPFSVAGLGNRMRAWCDTADLPHCSMHGLRKAMARRLAESGATDAQGQAVTGHKKAETFAYYRAKADRTALADTALSNLRTRYDDQP